MQPERIIIIRHAESMGNINKHIYAQTPDYALPLTPKGQKQATDCGNQLHQLIGHQKIQLYISPWRRTRETFMGIARQIPRAQWQAQEDPRLREQNWGHFREATLTDKIKAERDNYGTFEYRFGNGESGADVYDRISLLLETIHRDFKKPTYPPNCGFITHGFTMRMILTRWLHLSPETFETLANPRNCEMWVLQRGTQGKYALTHAIRKHASEKKHSALPPGYEQFLNTGHAKQD